MKTIQLTFLFEDTGFCKDVFQSVNQPYYYCNRDTVDLLVPPLGAET